MVILQLPSTNNNKTTLLTDDSSKRSTNNQPKSNIKGYPIKIPPTPHPTLTPTNLPQIITSIGTMKDRQAATQENQVQLNIACNQHGKCHHPAQGIIC